MKKMILAIAAVAAFANVNAQSSVHTGHATDATTVSMSMLIDNALYLSPESNVPLSQEVTLGQLMAGGDLTIGSVAFNVWSNREYNVSYAMTGIPGGNLAYQDISGDNHDGDDDNVIPVNNVRMTVSNTANLNGANPALAGEQGGAGYAAHNYNDFSQTWTNGNGLNANGGTIFNEARPAGQGVNSPAASWGAFTLNWTLENPQSSVIGGTYSCSITVTATQE